MVVAKLPTRQGRGGDRGHALKAQSEIKRDDPQTM